MTAWGIVGTGQMAAAMAGAIREAGADVVAVAGRTADGAGSFAGRHGISRWFDSVDALANLGLDAVYVATTNQRHLRDATAILEAGVAVLCEKPLALDAAQAARMAEAARASGALLIEAMWMVFQPAFQTMERLIGEGVIGWVHHIAADFGLPPTSTREAASPTRHSGEGHYSTSASTP
jgi:predicted dehydrogenase